VLYPSAEIENLTTNIRLLNKNTIYIIYMGHLKGKNATQIFLGLLMACLLTSCIGSKNVTYFQNLSGAKRSEMEAASKFTEPIIQVDDILSITITTIDPQSAAVVNQASSQSSVGSSNQQISGFLVDKDGYIELSLLGKFKVAGLTTSAAKQLIYDKASKDLRNPIVTIRFANFKISVLGEVARPASYSLPNEKVSILDVLSLAGDLTIYGKRENILVIRDVNGKKEFGRLNLNTVDIFNNPYYYLKQNDVVYVEPNKSKVTSLNTPIRTQFVVLLSAISTTILIFTRLNR
jgi:polysaccharide export outer membrane protein